MTTNTLDVTFTGTLYCKYRKRDIEINPNEIKDDLRYNDLQLKWSTGNGYKKANILYYNRHSILESVIQIFDLDNGLENKWGEPLNYDAIKFLVIKNLNTAERDSAGVYTEYDRLLVTFKDDKYIIGPGGSRILIEPYGKGYEGEVSSESFEEGLFIVNNIGGKTVNFDLIIVGSEYEETSSSGI